MLGTRRIRQVSQASCYSSALNRAGAHDAEFLISLWRYELWNPLSYYCHLLH